MNDQKQSADVNEYNIKMIIMSLKKRLKQIKKLNIKQKVKKEVFP